jgi:hypothetical protein
MPRILKTLLLAFAFCLLAGPAILFALRESKPVLILINPDIDAVRPRSICILNPFRDRSPEHSAEACLESMANRNLDCIRPLLHPDQAEHFTSRETKWPVQSWRVGRRWNNPGSVGLMYWVRRGGGYGPVEEEVYFNLEMRLGNAKLTSFDAMY